VEKRRELFRRWRCYYNSKSFQEFSYLATLISSDFWDRETSPSEGDFLKGRFWFLVADANKK